VSSYATTKPPWGEDLEVLDAVLCMMLFQHKQVGQDIFQDFKTFRRRWIGKLSAEREHVADIVYANPVASSIDFDMCRTWTNAVQSDHMGCAFAHFRQFTNELIQKIQRLRNL